MPPDIDGSARCFRTFAGTAPTAGEPEPRRAAATPCPSPPPNHPPWRSTRTRGTRGTAAATASAARLAAGPDTEPAAGRTAGLAAGPATEPTAGLTAGPAARPAGGSVARPAAQPAEPAIGTRRRPGAGSTAEPAEPTADPQRGPAATAWPHHQRDVTDRRRTAGARGGPSGWDRPDSVRVSRRHCGRRPGTHYVGRPCDRCRDRDTAPPRHGLRAWPPSEPLGLTDPWQGLRGNWLDAERTPAGPRSDPCPIPTPVISMVRAHPARASSSVRPEPGPRHLSDRPPSPRGGQARCARAPLAGSGGCQDRMRAGSGRCQFIDKSGSKQIVPQTTVQALVVCRHSLALAPRREGSAYTSRLACGS